jgi:hypothetical protein
MTRPPYRGVPFRPPADFPVVRGQDLAPVPHPIWDAVAATFDEPFVGITTDGNARTELFDAAEGRADEGLVEAGRAYAASLDLEQREQWIHPVDSPVWREWTNAFPRWAPKGVLLEDLDAGQRDAAMRVVEASLSPEGFATVRTVMRLDELLGELADHMRDTLAEWVYWFTLFGEPSAEAPWGWQLMGHHLDLHCYVHGDQVVVTPTFLGAEVGATEEGLFERERHDALAFMRALTPAQRDVAVLYPSILTKDLPPELDHPSNGRMRAGAGSDNAVIAYEGLRAATLSAEQRELLLALLATHTALLPAEQRRRRLAEIARHLDETHLAWMGPTGRDDAFYYKVQSPVVLIEYDCHKGVFLEADEPLAFHTHVVVRTPNGNDYGRALLEHRHAEVAR